jgi:RimJ/RimL family protein N-acetyltransferase
MIDNYIFLKKQFFTIDKFKIVPIRFADRYDIMKWRNEQLYHLRQLFPLTEKEQDSYFYEIVKKLFTTQKPPQVLFSYLCNDICIGYGGLVHINWIDRNGEISFIMDTKLEAEQFELHWSNFLILIEKVGFGELKLHKLITYAFDLRPNLYNVLEKNGFYKEAILKEQVFYADKYINAIIHAKLNSKC